MGALGAACKGVPIANISREYVGQGALGAAYGGIPLGGVSRHPIGRELSRGLNTRQLMLVRAGVAGDKIVTPGIATCSNHKGNLRRAAGSSSLTNQLTPGGISSADSFSTPEHSVFLNRCTWPSSTFPTRRTAFCSAKRGESKGSSAPRQTNGAAAGQVAGSHSPTSDPLRKVSDNGGAHAMKKDKNEQNVSGSGVLDLSGTKRKSLGGTDVEVQGEISPLFPPVSGEPPLVQGEILGSEKDKFLDEGSSKMVLNRVHSDDGTFGLSSSEHKMLAAVDLGTNSFHMVVVRADQQGRFQIEDVEKEDVRLGSGSAGFSVITPEAEERALSAIRRLKKIAANRRAAMRVVATSAVREARNRRTFIRRIHEVTGVEVEVLSGREEACLIYMGILQALPVFNKTVLTVDIGGGSTEFVLGRAGKPLFATSLKLGHIRLTERFVGSEPLSRVQIDEMRRFIRVALADSGVVEVVHSTDFDVAIGSSGTIETLEQLVHHHAGGGGAGEAKPGSEQGGGHQKAPLGFAEKEFNLEELSAVVKKICKAKTPESRAKIPGLPEKRSDVIVGGAILLEEIFLAMGIQKMLVSPYALREGVIVDTLARTCQAFCPTPNLRRSSVLNLASKFNVDRRMDSALHSAKLALEILGGLQTCRAGGKDCMSEAVQRLEESDAELLEAATILHYVGMFISHKGYHKHSHYLIKNNEHLLGFTPIEVEMIALLARYHRKKVPSIKDEDFAKLPEEVQKRVRALCAVIRIAVALDRCDSGSVSSVHTLQDHNSVVLAVTPAVDPKSNCVKDVSLELWAARAELEYFEKVYKRKTSIVMADLPDMESLKADQTRNVLSS